MSAEDVADTPPAVETVTSTTPVPAGLVAMTVESLETVNDSAAVVPKVTEVVLKRLDPVMVTVVPPVVSPLEGLIELTTGTST